ncbi:MAG: beta-ketoacyl synthase chain length factor [Elusimicrobiaceae bacterium]
MLPKLYLNGFYCLTGEAKAEDFSPFMDIRKLRRAETIAKNVLYCSFKALAQAGVNTSEEKNFGISLAMGAGALGNTLKFMDSIIEDGDELSSPTAFAGSVHNSTALMLSMLLNVKGPCVVTGQLDSSFAGALLTAQQFLAKKMCRQVLVAVTEDVNPLIDEILSKDANILNPFIYQPSLLSSRVAGAMLLSAEPEEATSFVLQDLGLFRTDDKKAKSLPQIALRSCAHSILELNKYLCVGTPFLFEEQFAGAVLKFKGEPYVRP